MSPFSHKLIQWGSENQIMILNEGLRSFFQWCPDLKWLSVFISNGFEKMVAILSGFQIVKTIKNRLLVGLDHFISK